MKEIDLGNDVTLKLVSENLLSGDTAKIIVYINKKPAAQIDAVVEPKEGVDGKYYPSVSLKRIK